MRLKNISKHFNNDSILDGYTGAFLFKAHTSAHDDHTSSGATARRRTMRTVPGTTAPARRVVQLYDDFWLVGNANLDSYDGLGVRRSYGLKKSTGLMALLSPADACAAATGLAMHAQKEFYRDTVNPTTESETDVMWNIFCPFNEAVAKGSFLRQDGRLYRVRSVYPTVDEYLVAEADELDPDAAQTAVFTANGERDLVTDRLPVISVTVSVVQFDDAKFYRFSDEVEADRKPGDCVVFLPAVALAVAVGAQFDMLGSTWQVRAVADEIDALALHVRLA